MANGSDVESRLKGLAAAWALVLGVGTFSLHAMGYLALRFRLRALGIEADLGVLNERFLFEGAHCLLYVLTSLPLLLLLTLPLFVLLGLARLVPGWRARVERVGNTLGNLPPRWLAISGLAWGTLAVQLVMRHVFVVQNLLLGQGPIEPPWLRAVLLDPTGFLEPLLFAGLLVLLAPTIFAFVRLPRGSLLVARSLLGMVLLAQLLLLPVHFGVFGAGAPVPRVASLPGEESSSRVWKVFSTAKAAVFLVERPGVPAVRRLLTLDVEKLERLEVMEHQPLLRILADQKEPCGP